MRRGVQVPGELLPTGSGPALAAVGLSLPRLQDMSVWMRCRWGRVGAQEEEAGCQGICQPFRTLILARSPSAAGSRQVCFVLALTGQAVGK